MKYWFEWEKVKLVDIWHNHIIKDPPLIINNINNKEREQ